MWRMLFYKLMPIFVKQNDNVITFREPPAAGDADGMACTDIDNGQ